MPVNILYITFYYAPDLAAGSFRAPAFVDSMVRQFGRQIRLHVITTMPNRYDVFSAQADAVPEEETRGPVRITRIPVGRHGGKFLAQALLFRKFYAQAMRRTKEESYDLVIGTGGRFFTNYLAYRIARKKRALLALDIRDIFIESVDNLGGHPMVAAGIKAGLPLLRRLERRMVSFAAHVNLVSPGFNSYFNSHYPGRLYSNYTNGLDDIFHPYAGQTRKNITKDTYRVVYAGNLGMAQALHRIIPFLDKAVAGRFSFDIIGDGSAKNMLLEGLAGAPHIDARLHAPRKREELLAFYTEADIFFIHLDNIPAYRRVLPSKIFEYAIFGKTLVAGVAGYCAGFLRNECPQARVFDPCDAVAFNAVFASIAREGVCQADMNLFLEKFRRSRIMDEYTRNLMAACFPGQRPDTP